MKAVQAKSQKTGVAWAGGKNYMSNQVKTDNKLINAKANGTKPLQQINGTSHQNTLYLYGIYYIDCLNSLNLLRRNGGLSKD